MSSLTLTGSMTIVAPPAGAYVGGMISYVHSSDTGLEAITSHLSVSYTSAPFDPDLYDEYDVYVGGLMGYTEESSSAYTIDNINTSASVSVASVNATTFHGCVLGHGQSSLVKGSLITCELVNRDNIHTYRDPNRFGPSCRHLYGGSVAGEIVDSTAESNNNTEHSNIDIVMYNMTSVCGITGYGHSVKNYSIRNVSVGVRDVNINGLSGLIDYACSMSISGCAVCAVSVDGWYYRHGC